PVTAVSLPDPSRASPSPSPCPGTATPAIFSLSLHAALPIFTGAGEFLSSPFRDELENATLSKTVGCDLRHEVSAGRSQPSWRASDRKSTRLNSSHVSSSYAVFCLK